MAAVLVLGLSGCGRERIATSNPFYLEYEIAPAPIVGEVVEWRFDVGVSRAYEQDYSGQVTLTFPKEIEVIAGETSWSGTVPYSGTVSLSPRIRVLSAGVHKVEFMVSHVAEGAAFALSYTFAVVSNTKTAWVTDFWDLYEPSPPPMVATPMRTPEPAGTP